MRKLCEQVQEEEAHLVSKKAIALKLVTNRKVRQGAVGFLKDPRGQEDPRLEDADQP